MNTRFSTELFDDFKTAESQRRTSLMRMHATDAALVELVRPDDIDLAQASRTKLAKEIMHDLTPAQIALLKESDEVNAKTDLGVVLEIVDDFVAHQRDSAIEQAVLANLQVHEIINPETGEIAVRPARDVFPEVAASLPLEEAPTEVEDDATEHETIETTPEEPAKRVSFARSIGRTALRIREFVPTFRKKPAAVESQEALQVHP